jgi:hypothetical protein
MLHQKLPEKQEQAKSKTSRMREMLKRKLKSTKQRPKQPYIVSMKLIAASLKKIKKNDKPWQI